MLNAVEVEDDDQIGWTESDVNMTDATETGTDTTMSGIREATTLQATLSETVKDRGTQIAPSTATILFVVNTMQKRTLDQRMAQADWILSQSFDEANELCSEAHRGYKRLLGPNHVDTLFVLLCLASLDQGRGRFKEAQSEYEYFASACSNLYGQLQANTLDYLHHFGIVQKGQEYYGFFDTLVLSQITAFKFLPMVLPLAQIKQTLNNQNQLDNSEERRCLRIMSNLLNVPI